MSKSAFFHATFILQAPIIPDRVKEKAYPGSTAVTALSQALCIASSSLSNAPVFDHLISCYGGDQYSIRLPIPVMAIAQSGKAALGKCNCINGAFSEDS